MGSDDHYPEEAPTHRVRVDAFSIDPTTVTNAEFAAFVAETGYVTVAERDPDPADFPDAPPRACSRARWSSTPPAGRWTCATSASGGAGSPARAGGTREDRRAPSTGCSTIPWCTSPTRTRWPTRPGWGRRCRPRPSGSTPPAAASTGRRTPGVRRPGPSGRMMANTWDGPDFPWRSIRRERLPAHRAGRQLPGQRLRALRHGRQRLGVDGRLVDEPTPRRRRLAVLRAGEPAWR